MWMTDFAFSGLNMLCTILSPLFRFDSRQLKRFWDTPRIPLLGDADLTVIDLIQVVRHVRTERVPLPNHTAYNTTYHYPINDSRICKAYRCIDKCYPHGIWRLTFYVQHLPTICKLLFQAFPCSFSICYMSWMQVFQSFPANANCNALT